MIRKRSVYDPLEPTQEPRWLEILDRHSRLLESRPLPPGADLKRAFIVAMLEHIDAGWKLGEFGSLDPSPLVHLDQLQQFFFPFRLLSQQLKSARPGNHYLWRLGRSWASPQIMHDHAIELRNWVKEQLDGVD